jgi:hypothetical protein
MFELTPYPTALFKDGYMRKPNKAMLYKEFCKDLTTASLPSNIVFVVDGGCLRHRVKWQKGSTGDDVMQMYVNQVTRRFKKSAMVVFDGYDSGADVKDKEHIRRLG